MTFKEMIAKHMQGKTLDEVCAVCNRLGVKIDNAYLSRLRSGVRPAPDNPELLRALSMALELSIEEDKTFHLLAMLERRPFHAFLEEITALGYHYRVTTLLLEKYQAAGTVLLNETHLDKEEGLAKLRDAQQFIDEFLPLMGELGEMFHRTQTILESYAKEQDNPLTKRRTGGASKTSEPTEGDLIQQLSETAGVDAELIQMSMAVLKRARESTSAKAEK